VRSNTYYYQDSLGSTSHIANASGVLLESYRYDLYGKPTYWDATGAQMSNSANGVVDLHGGARWIPELGLYDDRNRFMSPDLGRFLQPDPIGFKGDGSNLYRYCGNDWANRTDPTGEFYQQIVSGNSVTLIIPMHYTGSAATPANIATMNQGIQKTWSGQMGNYTVTTKVVPSATGVPTNNVAVDYGNDRSWAIYEGNQ
jgi:RHS repeat-associated protein